MDTPSEATNAHDAAPAPAPAAPAVTAASASTAAPTAASTAAPAATAAVDPAAGQTADKIASHTIEYQLRPQRPSQTSHLAQTQIAQPSLPNQTPTQPNPNQQNPAAQRRQRVMERDRYNYQSLGPSLNSAVKQVRVALISQKRPMRSASRWIEWPQKCLVIMDVFKALERTSSLYCGFAIATCLVTVKARVFVR